MTAPYPDETVIELLNGSTIRTDSFAQNPEGCSYVRVCDRYGMETGYWSYEEWAESPQEVMGAIMGAAKEGDNDQ